ncbi:MAG: type II toxin-antitoxin system VapB family antitoxin [Desulfohalobiaceae bacterium]|nr:type II toxin-antitoxin system VapB family antitoxin [Desulfohalobiaceae bacterium]
MRKTTVLLDENLLQSAMEAIQAKSKREAITAGLESLVKQWNMNKLREELGTYNLDLTLKDLESLRNDESISD